MESVKKEAESVTWPDNGEKGPFASIVPTVLTTFDKTLQHYTVHPATKKTLYSKSRNRMLMNCFWGVTKATNVAKMAYLTKCRPK